MFIVGIFDFLTTIEAARVDPNWATPVTSTTGYAFAAMFYLIFCYGMSRYARCVEARLARAATGGEGLAMAQQTADDPGSSPRRSKTDVAVDMIGVHKWYGDFHVLRDINLQRRRKASAS